MINAAYAAGEQGMWRPDTPRILETEVRALLDAGELIVVKRDGALAGCLRVHTLDAATAELGLLSAARRDSGVGGELVALAGAWARAGADAADVARPAHGHASLQGAPARLVLEARLPRDRPPRLRRRAAAVGAPADRAVRPRHLREGALSTATVALPDTRSDRFRHVDEANARLISRGERAREVSGGVVDEGRPAQVVQARASAPTRARRNPGSR